MIKNFFKFHPIHKKVVKYFDTLFLLRPSLFFPVWIILASGMITSSMQVDRYRIWINTFDLNTLIVFIGMTLITGVTFIINQIYDLESDIINNKILLMKNKISKESAIKICKLLLVIAFIILIPSGIINILLGSSLFLVWGILYNFKPFEYKQSPLMGVIINFIAGLLLFMIGWNLTGEIKAELVIFGLPYLFCFSAVSMLTAIPDIKGDKKINKKTFPISFGERLTIFLAMILVILAFIIGLKNNDPTISTAALVSLPFYIFNVFSLKLNNVLRTIRFSIFNLAFFLMSVYPFLIIAFGFNFYLIKYYYWHRFNMSYITFLIEE